MYSSSSAWRVYYGGSVNVAICVQILYRRGVIVAYPGEKFCSCPVRIICIIKSPTDRQTDKPWSILQISSEFVCIQQFVISGVNNSWRWCYGFQVKRSWNKFMMTDPQIKDCAPISAYPHVCFFITFSCRLLVFYQKVTRIEDKETVKVNIHFARTTVCEIKVYGPMF